MTLSFNHDCVFSVSLAHWRADIIVALVAQVNPVASKNARRECKEIAALNLRSKVYEPHSPPFICSHLGRVFMYFKVHMYPFHSRVSHVKRCALISGCCVLLCHLESHCSHRCVISVFISCASSTD